MIGNFLRSNRFVPVMLLVLVALHFAGTVTRFYWTTAWFGNALHALGGFWIAALARWVARARGAAGLDRPRGIVPFAGILGVVALAGVLWEFFEFGMMQIFGDALRLPLQLSIAETVGDLAFDLLGGIAFLLLILF